MIGPRHLFWDSCVFIRYLTRIPPEGIADLEDLVRDTQRKADAERRKVIYSTIVFTELRPRFLKPGQSIGDFFDDLGASFEPIDPNPNILRAAGELRDAVVTDPSTKKPSNRVIGTPDAIHLMTCVWAKRALGLDDIVFHTYDAGKGTSWEGKCVPLLSFER